MKTRKFKFIFFVIVFIIPALGTSCPDKHIAGGEILKTNGRTISLCYTTPQKSTAPKEFERRLRAPPSGFKQFERLKLFSPESPSLKISSQFISSPPTAQAEGSEDDLAPDYDTFFFRIETGKVIVAVRPEFCSEWIPWSVYEVRCDRSECKDFPKRPENELSQPLSGVLFDENRIKDIDPAVIKAVATRDVRFFKKNNGKQLCQLASLASQCDKNAFSYFTDPEMTKKVSLSAEGDESISSLINTLSRVRWKKGCPSL